MSRLDLACVQQSELFQAQEYRNRVLTSEAAGAIALCRACDNLEACRQEVNAGVYEGVKGIVAAMTTKDRANLKIDASKKVPVLPRNAIVKQANQGSNTANLMQPGIPSASASRRDRYKTLFS